MNKLTPRPHQLAAINAITQELSINDRTTVVMACGSGKTLVALWAAKELKPECILILLPSLALISQVLKTWMQEGNWSSSNTLCICSDETIGDDALTINRSELDFPVTTDKEIIKQFLNKNIEHKIVFSTYQSCHLIPNDFKFDLGIFDEAHKTAGNKDKQFSYSLTNKNINISKRLFMTATPKHINVNKTDKNGEKIAAYSMDNEDIYGKVCYKLSFADAVKQDIICGYKVIISVLTSNDINRDLIKHGVTNIKKNKIHAKNIAHALALNNATKENNIKKVFTFHNTVKEAQVFSKINYNITKLKSIHINGKMNSVERGSILSDFKDANQAVLSNARCLTEGVDIPAVDMIAFMSPKKGEIDIIQAVGRAMRKHNGKKEGYVLVPIFLEGKTECIEDALNDTEYNYVWNILQYLQEYDDDLAGIITDMQKSAVRERRIYQADYERLSRKVQILGIGQELQLHSLQRSILTKVVDNLTSLWDKRFEELLDCKEKYGLVDVFKYSEGLGKWSVDQRQKRKENILSQPKIDKLNSIGFIWDPHNDKWNNNFKELVIFKERFGHTNVPKTKGSKVSLEYKKLSSFVDGLRQQRIQKNLSQEQIDKLNSIGFIWSPFDKKWEDKFLKFANLDNKYNYQNKELKKWEIRQRRNFIKNKLSQKQIDKLNSIGFVFDVRSDVEWNKKFRKLEEFLQKHGHLNIKSHINGKKVKFYYWVKKHRELYKENKLSQDRINKLNSIGFVWEVRKETK